MTCNRQIFSYYDAFVAPEYYDNLSEQILEEFYNMHQTNFDVSILYIASYEDSWVFEGSKKLINMLFHSSFSTKIVVIKKMINDNLLEKKIMNESDVKKYDDRCLIIATMEGHWRAFLIKKNYI